MYHPPERYTYLALRWSILVFVLSLEIRKFKFSVDVLVNLRLSGYSFCSKWFVLKLSLILLLY